MSWRITGQILDPATGESVSGVITALLDRTPARTSTGGVIERRASSIPVVEGDIIDTPLHSVPGAVWTFVLPLGQRSVRIDDPGDGASIDLGGDLPVGTPVPESEAVLLRRELSSLREQTIDAVDTITSTVDRHIADTPSGGYAPFYAARDRHWAPITYWWADYWNPTGNWARTLTDPDVLGPMLINIGNGAGSAVDQDWLRQVKIARARGCKIMGYVSTLYGQRSRADILADVDKHVRFYGVDGIFLDEMTNGVGDGVQYIPAYRDLYQTLKSLYGEAFWIVGNPGTSTAEEVLACADTVMVYESDAAYYLNPTWDIHPSYYADYPSTKFWHVVHTVTSREQALAVLKAASKLRPAFFYMTDLRFDAGASNPYATPPAQWLIDMQIQWARRADPARIVQDSPTQARPTGLTASDAGMEWWDDSLKRRIVWTGTQWTDMAGGAV